MNKKLSGFIGALALVFILSATAQAEIFFAYLNGAQEVPAVATNATGYGRVVLNESAGTISFTVVFNNLSSNQTASHIHTGAIGVSGPVTINFGAVGGTSGTITGTAPITPAQIALLRAHQFYINVHSANNGGGEIRGQLGVKRPVDFDGDGRNDFSILRFPNVAPPGQAPITFYNLNSTTGFQSVPFGDANTDFPAPGDYDGDGRDDITLYRRGAAAGAQSFYHLLRSSDGTLQSTQFGLFGDLTVARDYDGDGKTDFAVWRRGATAGAQAFWYICNSATVAPASCSTNFRTVQWGTTGNGTSTGDTPVAGDYDGDGKFDVAVYRFGGLAPNNSFLILRSSDGAAQYSQFGNFQTDYIAPGDFDGDGKYDLTAVRTGAAAANPMTWFILQSSNNQLRSVQFGISSDVPAQGDYDGDARADIAVYRAGATGAQSFFHIIRSFDNTLQTTQWGNGGDFAVNTFDAR
ncbi:MAG TPA: CHRD domain-containing protein [Pyrinomonadaceae bacterium]